MGPSPAPAGTGRAILKLRAPRANGNLDASRAYHLAQERQRVHQARCANGVIPATR
jgi:hypothetical protein